MPKILYSSIMLTYLKIIINAQFKNIYKDLIKLYSYQTFVS